MIVRITTLTNDELERLEESMRDSALWLRMLGNYAQASVCKSIQMTASQHLLRREADHRQEVARQLTLIPPGAYE
jgi:hypothetical protein